MAAVFFFKMLPLRVVSGAAAGSSARGALVAGAGAGAALASAFLAFFLDFALALEEEDEEEKKASLSSGALPLLRAEPSVDRYAKARATKVTRAPNPRTDGGTSTMAQINEPKCARRESGWSVLRKDAKPASQPVSQLVVAISSSTSKGCGRWEPSRRRED